MEQQRELSFTLLQINKALKPQIYIQGYHRAISVCDTVLISIYQLYINPYQ